MPETDDQKAVREAAEAEAARKVEEDTARQRLSDLEDRTRKAEEARIRAEAERDGFVKAMEASKAANGQAAWTDEQWANYEAQSGFTKQQTIALAQMTEQQRARMEESVAARVAEAEKKAQDAETRLAKFEGRQSAEAAVSEYVASRPALQRHKATVKEFVDKFASEADMADPKKRAEILSAAELYAKGKVGGTVNKDEKGQNRGGGFDQGGENDGGSGSGDEPGVNADLRGLRESERRTIQHISKNLTTERTKQLAEYEHEQFPGVMVSGERVWEEGKPKFNR